MTFDDITFRSDGVTCSAWHFRGLGDGLAGPGGRPVVVMAHGFGGTKDAGLQPFAERISAAGIDVLAFDYRGFGASEGEPRQSISIKRQMQDYHAAVDAAKSLARGGSAAGSRSGVRRCRVDTCSTWPPTGPTWPR